VFLCSERNEAGQIDLSGPNGKLSLVAMELQSIRRQHSIGDGRRARPEL
jgi:hypothetical protein